MSGKMPKIQKCLGINQLLKYLKKTTHINGFKITSGPLIPLGGEIQTPMNHCRLHPKHLLCHTYYFITTIILSQCNLSRLPFIL